MNGSFKFVGDIPQYMTYSIAEFACDAGFDMVGEDDVLSCLEDQTWSGEIPTCAVHECIAEPDTDDPKSKHIYVIFFKSKTHSLFVL